VSIKGVSSALKKWPFAVSHDGTLLAVADGRSTVCIYDIAQLERIASLREFSGHITALCFVGDSFNQTVAVVTSAGVIERRAITNGEVEGLCNSSRSAYHSICQFGDDLLVAVDQTGAVESWSLKNTKLVKTLYAPRPYDGVDLTGTKGLTNGQKAVLFSMGAYEE